MLSFIARRLVSGAAMLLVITTLAFFMLYAGGGDIARRILGQQATQQQVLDKAHALGLDQPFLSQYGSWLSHALRGDLGSSWFNGQHVAVAMATRLRDALADPPWLLLTPGTARAASSTASAISRSSAGDGSA